MHFIVGDHLQGENKRATHKGTHTHEETSNVGIGANKEVSAIKTEKTSKKITMYENFIKPVACNDDNTEDILFSDFFFLI